MADYNRQAQPSPPAGPTRKELDGVLKAAHDRSQDRLQELDARAMGYVAALEHVAHALRTAPEALLEGDLLDRLPSVEGLRLLAVEVGALRPHVAALDTLAAFEARAGA